MIIDIYPYKFKRRKDRKKRKRERNENDRSLVRFLLSTSLSFARKALIPQLNRHCRVILMADRLRNKKPVTPLNSVLHFDKITRTSYLL